MSTSPKFLTLWEKFKDHKESYLKQTYNEAQVRQEFLDPLFSALGWDMENKNGYAEAYKDVVHEDSLRVEGKIKAPDYGFRIGGTRKFFLEAKKPAIDIKNDTQAALQLRRYAWSAKLSLSILTNFHQVAIYDCRYKPDESDTPSKARIAFFELSELDQAWEFLERYFARDSILKGSFDKFALDAEVKRGTSTVDDQFLAQIESWREALAKNIHLRNSGLSQGELNIAVARTIDRLIFLRIAEDRALESYGRLRDAAKSKGIYRNICTLFKQADDRYNSGLFHFDPKDGNPDTADHYTLELIIDDKILKSIINNLYYPASPYEFSVISADILGHVYEQFLGKQIIVSGRAVSIVEKPEVKKAGGVYYTPNYVVRYIIERTVGSIFEKLTPAQASGLDRRTKNPQPIRIVDPACGSGSFLIEAYQYLLEWYLDRYKTSGPERHARGASPKLYEISSGEWRLTIAERRRILITHIFGVDIDAQAVEVAKLSLLLKVLEGTKSDEVERQIDMFRVRALPDLGNNIRSGNSLVSSDLFSNKTYDAFGDAALEKINPFDWEEEFPFFSESGGFDVVIGNPPYGASLNKDEKEYFRKKCKHQSYQFDSYLVFIEKALSFILKNNGLFGMIIPNPWLTNINQSSLRRFVINNSVLSEIVHFKFPVFKKVTVDTEIVIFQKKSSRRNKFLAKFVKQIAADQTISLFEKVIQHDQSVWRELSDDGFNIFLDEQRVQLAAKIRAAGGPCREVVSWSVGIKPYQVGKGTPPQTKEIVERRPFDANAPAGSAYRQYIRGGDFSRFTLQPIEQRWIKYGRWLAEPRPNAGFDAKEKVVVRQTGDRLVAAIDRDQLICMNNVHVGVVTDSDFDADTICGLLNSDLLNWYFHYLNPEMGEALAEVKKANVAKLPIVRKSSLNTHVYNRVKRESISLQKLSRKYYKCRLNSDKDRIRRGITVSFRSLNEAVFELYGLDVSRAQIITADQVAYTGLSG